MIEPVKKRLIEASARGLFDARFNHHFENKLEKIRVKLASIRLIAQDIRAVVAFYEKVTMKTADWPAPVFAEIVTASATLAIGSAETVRLFKEGTLRPGANHTAVLEFQVDDLQAEYDRLKDQVAVVLEPKLMPWGNITAQFRDPEGNLVALYTPVTDEAKRRFASR